MDFQKKICREYTEVRVIRSVSRTSGLRKVGFSYLVLTHVGPATAAFARTQKIKTSVVAADCDSVS